MVAPDWLDRFPDESTKQLLFYRWFDESSALALLRCLSWHFSSVEPLPGNSNQHRFQRSSLVVPVSANIAAHMLTQRFTEDSKQQISSGIKDILEEGIKNPAAAEELAGLLAAVPDRVVLLPPSTCSALQADVFVPFLTQKLVDYVQHDIQGRKYIPVTAEILSRVIQRGHAQLVASTVAEAVVLSYASSNIMKGEAVSKILFEFPASSALEKLLESLLRVLPYQHTTSVDKNIEAKLKEEDQKEEEKTVLLLNCLITLLPVQLWQQHSDIRLLFEDKLLTQKVLSSLSLTLLLGYLNFISSTVTTTTTSNGASLEEQDVDANPATTFTTTEDVLAAATWRVASQWGDKTSIQRLPAPQQAYMTSILLQSLPLLGKARFEGYLGLPPAVLRGISTRLESPRELVRRQAMRVGKVMSQVLDGNAPPLFGDEDIELMAEEQWDSSVPAVETKDDEKRGKKKSSGASKKNKKGEKTRSRKPTTYKSTRKDDIDEDYPMTETDSDDNDIASDSSSSTDSEFEKYDLEESDDDDVSKTNLQLRDIISLIQKSESDWKGHLRALRSVEALIHAAPDELSHYSVPLARTLLLTTAPVWTDEEVPPGQDPIEDQRFRSLVALTAAVPEAVGLSLAAEVYSPSLDMQQRSRALAVMATAAQELSSPGSVLKALKGKEEGSNSIHDNGERSKSTQRYLQGEKLPGKAGRVVRASQRSLAAASSEPHQKSATQANRFPPIALKWAAALLKECDVRRHGVDLFGRDYFILGRLLATLGTFLEASQQSLEAAPLAAAIIELIKGQNVHDNEEPYVRRAALMAASHACMAVPPGAVSISLLSSNVSSASMGLSSVAKSQSLSSSSSSVALVERLEWLRGWAEDTAENDSDDTCRMMAAACRGLHGALAAEAMASLAASVSEQQSLRNGNDGGNVILPSFSESHGRSMPSVKVGIPRIETLSLK